MIRKFATSAWVSLPSSNLLIGVLGVVTSSLVARNLGPSERGILSASMLGSFWVLTIGGLVNTQSMTFAWAKSDDHDKTFTVALSLVVVLSLFLMPAVLLFNHVLAQRADIDLFAANINMLIVPTTLLVACLTPILVAEGKFGRFGATRLTTSITYTLGIILLMAIGQVTIVNITIVTISSPFAAIILSCHWLTQSHHFRWHWGWKQLAVITSYGFATNVSSLPYQLNSRLDQMAMALWLPAEMLGYYVIAIAWSSTQSFIGNGISVILLSNSSNACTSDVASIRKVIGQFRIASVLLLCLGAGATIATPLGVRLLFGTQYSQAIVPAMILSVASSIANIKLLLHEVARGLGQPSLGAWAEGLGLIITALMLSILLPTWGITGAAVSSLCSYLVAAIALAVMMGKHTGIPLCEFAPTLGVEWRQALTLFRRVHRNHSTACNG
jgi:O-antigen/teichoic acid export membrane protein